MTHDGSIHTEYFIPFPEFSAQCSCGWGGFTRDSPEMAEMDLNAHYSEMEEQR